MNQTIIKSYFRSVQRGIRTLDQVPEALRDAVGEMLEKEWRVKSGE